MTRAEVITAIREQEPQLRLLGVMRASLFGSVARDEARVGSDVDVAIKLDRKLVGLRRLARLDLIRGVIADKLGCEVDVVEEPTVKHSPLRGELARDAVRAF